LKLKLAYNSAIYTNRNPMGILLFKAPDRHNTELVHNRVYDGVLSIPSPCDIDGL